MSVAFAAAELCAKHGVPAIPLGQNKRPTVRGFKFAELTVDRSRAWFRSQPDAAGLGVPDGEASGIVRLDIDESGIELEVCRRAGTTPAMVVTASGKLHFLYRYNGERRLTGAPGHANARPWPDLKVDLCGGGGYSVTPPSRCGDRDYVFVGGLTLEKLLERRHELPVIKGLDERAYIQSTDNIARTTTLDGAATSPLALVPIGGRDAAFFPVVARICQRAFRAGAARQDALAESIARNQEFQVPLPATEVKAKVEHWWRETLAGRNWYGIGHGPRGRPKVMQPIAARDPYLCALLVWLREENGPSSEFWVANGLVKLLPGWSFGQLRAARNRALSEGWVEMIAPAAQGRHALFRWGPTARRIFFPNR